MLEPTSIVAKAGRSLAAKRKQTYGLPEDGPAVHSFASPRSPATRLSPPLPRTSCSTLYAKPTAIQRKTLNLLPWTQARIALARSPT
jgi:hypothetical protein